MKKAVSFFLAALLMLSLAACGNEGGGAEQTSEVSEVSGSTSESSAQETQNTASEESSSSDTASAAAENTENDGDRVLVAYFSWADNAVLAEDVDAVSSPSVIPPGNVQQLAGWVQEETGGDLFSIQVTDPYPSDWDECLSRANQERSENARPELVQNVEDLEQYDTVFLGYQLVVRRPYGTAFFPGTERSLRQAGVSVLLTWNRRAGQQCGAYHRGGAGCTDF